MRKDIILMPLSSLRSHESINKERLKIILSKIKSDGIFYKPVIVDNKKFIILDGHHRVAALKILGAKTVPVYLVNYQSQDVKIYLRRKKLLSEFIKEKVVEAALSKELLPYKTTRHCLKVRPNRIKVSLAELN